MCADDYGLSAPVDAGIVALAARGRLSALSCMASAPRWPEAAAALAALPARVSVGLHVNLTEGRFLGVPRAMPTPARLLAAIIMHRLPVAFLAREIHAQWDAFERARGRAPDFVDSHQHVHVLAPVRAALLEVMRARGAPVAVRNLHPAFGPSDARAKRVAIRLLGAAGLARALDAQGVARSGAFGGLQRFAPDAPVRAGWRTLLGRASDGALIACHPADGAPAGDPIGAFRAREFAYLASEAFEADCAEFGVVRVPFASPA